MLRCASTGRALVRRRGRNVTRSQVAAPPPRVWVHPRSSQLARRRPTRARPGAGAGSCVAHRSLAFAVLALRLPALALLLTLSEARLNERSIACASPCYLLAASTRPGRGITSMSGAWRWGRVATPSRAVSWVGRGWVPDRYRGWMSWMDVSAETWMPLCKVKCGAGIATEILRRAAQRCSGALGRSGGSEVKG